MENTNRIQWLDIAKGITIILMILGHSSLPKIASDFIFAFHMPLFFIASGLTTTFAMEGGGGNHFIINKIRKLIIPFVIYSFIVLSIELFFLPAGTQTFIHWLSCGWEGMALWFIPVLFLALIVAYLIVCYSCGVTTIIISCVILALIGGAISYWGHYLPWTLATVPYATALILLGYLCKPLVKYISSFPIAIIIFGLIITLVISHFFRLDMAFNCVTPVIVLSVGAISGTSMMFALSKIIETKTKYTSKILQAIGKETYLILAFSQIIIVLLKQYTEWNSLVRYLLLIVILICLKYIKDGFKYLFAKI